MNCAGVPHQRASGLPLSGLCPLHLQAKYREALAAGLDADRAVEATFGLVSMPFTVCTLATSSHTHTHTHRPHDSNLQATCAAACCLWAHRPSACRVGRTCSGSCCSRHLTSCWAIQAMCSRCSRLWQMLTMQACRPISRWAGSMCDTLLLLYGRLCLIRCAWEVTQAWDKECFCLLDGARGCTHLSLLLTVGLGLGLCVAALHH